MITEPRVLSDWIELVRAEYLEMPGLHLTKAQMRRLWGLDAEVRDAVVDQLVADHFLRQTAAGGYVLTSSPAA